MKMREIASSVVALSAAPGLLLVQRLAGPDSWLLFVLTLSSALVGFFTWQLLSAYKWVLQTEPHVLYFRGSALGLASAVGIAGFYAVWLVSPYHLYVRLSNLVIVKVLLCLYNWVLLSSLASSAHVSLVYSRRRGIVLWAPFAVQLGLLPWLTPDRCPFAAQPRWPSYWHHGAAGFSLAVSCLCCFCPDVRVTLALESRWSSTTPAGSVCTYYERVPQACAILSMLYLTSVYMWENSIGNAAYWHGFYHMVWSYLRPAYAALFAVYFLKGSDYFRAANNIACGLGFVFFTTMATLTETTMTLHCLNMFERRFGFSHTGAHGVEALCFQVSIMLFYLHGLTSGAWQDGEPRVFRRVPFVVLMCGLAVVLFSLLTAGQFLRFSCGDGLTLVALVGLDRYYMGRMRAADMERFFVDYLLPYGSIACATAYITARRSKVPRHLLIFKVEETLGADVVEPGSEKQMLQPP